MWCFLHLFYSSTLHISLIFEWKTTGREHKSKKNEIWASLLTKVKTIRVSLTSQQRNNLHIYSTTHIYLSEQMSLVTQKVILSLLESPSLWWITKHHRNSNLNLRRVFQLEGGWKGNRWATSFYNSKGKGWTTSIKNTVADHYSYKGTKRV